MGGGTSITIRKLFGKEKSWLKFNKLNSLYFSFQNNDSFNKINLQLHASSNKVSNPHSFSIKSNTEFSGSVQAALPTTETLLREVVTDSINNMVYTLSTGNYPNNKNWAFIDASDDTDVYGTRYVGVTPGKSYTVTADISTYGNSFYCSSEIYYSAEINTHAPDVEDY